MTMSDMKIIRLVKRDCCSGRVEEVCEEIEGVEMKRGGRRGGVNLRCQRGKSFIH